MELGQYPLCATLSLEPSWSGTVLIPDYSPDGTKLVSFWNMALTSDTITWALVQGLSCCRRGIDGCCHCLEISLSLSQGKSGSQSVCLWGGNAHSFTATHSGACLSKEGRGRKYCYVYCVLGHEAPGARSTELTPAHLLPGIGLQLAPTHLSTSCLGHHHSASIGSW